VVLDLGRDEWRDELESRHDSPREESMKNLFSAVIVAFVLCIIVVSPPMKSAAAADGGASDAGSAPGPSDCAA
jgi:hypothetical protein